MLQQNLLKLVAGLGFEPRTWGNEPLMIPFH
nr:MAG TPA: hypothetical protein [Caudoviricetes sp.]